MIQLEAPPRDIIIDSNAKDKYRSLGRRLNLDNKSVFILAMKAGFFFNVRKKLTQKSHIGQVSTFSQDDLKYMVIIAFSALKNTHEIFNGKQVLEICQEFANGGVEHLYNLFISTDKDDARVIEDIIGEVETRVNLS